MKRERLIAAIDAFSDAMEEQRGKYGWPLYPKPRFADWPENEKAAALAAFKIFLKTYGDAR
jgi:hypothetical protein